MRRLRRGRLPRRLKCLVATLRLFELEETDLTLLELGLLVPQAALALQEHIQEHLLILVVITNEKTR